MRALREFTHPDEDYPYSKIMDRGFAQRVGSDVGHGGEWLKRQLLEDQGRRCAIGDEMVGSPANRYRLAG